MLKDTTVFLKAYMSQTWGVLVCGIATTVDQRDLVPPYQYL